MDIVCILGFAQGPPCQRTGRTTLKENLHAKEVRDYLNWLEHTRGRTHATVHSYRRVIDVWLQQLGPRPLEAVTPAEIERFLHRRRTGRAHGAPAAPSTQARDAAALRGFYGYLVARNQLRRNPTLLVCTPPIRNVQPKAIGDQLWALLWENSREHEGVVLGLGFFAGLRREEIVRLTVGHVDLVQRRLVRFVRKGGGEDVLPVGTMLDVFSKRMPSLQPERLWPLVEDVCSRRYDEEPLVPWETLCYYRKTAPNTAHLSGADLNNWLNRYCRQIDVEHVHPHQLRHSCATNLLRAGVPLALASRLMNHSNIQTTMRYVRCGSDELQEWFNSQSGKGR
jgi:site-specific recombinase XerD